MIITGLILVALLLALFFSVMFVVTAVLMIFGLSALAISFVYYNISDGSLVMVLWVIPILLFLAMVILISLGWLSVIPPKFNRKEKTCLIKDYSITTSLLLPSNKLSNILLIIPGVSIESGFMT